MAKASVKISTLLSFSHFAFVLYLSFLLPLEASGQREFDYFVLALQWPGTLCGTTHHCCASNGCCRSEPITWFTIHGLWADYDDGSWPACCTHSEFDIKKISSLMPVLEKYWPSLSCSSPSRCFGGKGPFWAHEWEKHGTCSSPVILDEYSYFSTTLDLYSKHNVTKILDSAGILATNSEKYPLGDFVAIIKNAFGASPLLVCKHGSVEELRLCFYKDFKPRDCVMGPAMIDNMSNSRSSCPKYITLPTYKPISVGDISGEITRPDDNTFKSLSLA